MRNAKPLVALGALALFSATAGGAEEPCLFGDDSWGGQRRHLAVVNAAVDEPSDNVISLRGEWDFIARTNGRRGPKSDYPLRSHSWPFYRWCEPYLVAESGEPWKIRVPGCWEAQGVGSVITSQPWRCWWDCSRKRIRGFVGSGWYHRVVRRPDSWAGKRIWLKVGGVNSKGWFWVNDRPLAMVQSFCGTYKWEVTDFFDPNGELKIVAEISNTEPSRRGNFCSTHCWGGIIRDIELEATPEVFIDDAWVRGDFDGRCAEAKVEVEGEQRTDSFSLRVTVEGETKEATLHSSPSTFTLEVPLRDFRPWSPEHPNLYTAKVELVENGRVVQTRLERFGVRKLEVRGKEIFFNGRPFHVRGAGWHNIDPMLGAAPADREYFRACIRRIKAAGFNAVRFHTHCKYPECFEAADEEGLLIQAELPYYKDFPTGLFAFDPAGDATELWRHYRRYPSFAIYCGGNEGDFGSVLSKNLYGYVKRMDPDRLFVGQDGSNVSHLGGNEPGTSDLVGGWVSEWPRGSFDPDRPFIQHEYMNVTVKCDTRLADRFTGVWVEPVSREARRKFLSAFGLDLAFGDRLHDAQNALQAFWLKHGIETARADPYSDGYWFWSLQDACSPQAGTISAQGLYDPFWGEKRHGISADCFRTFNSPSCVLLDLDRGHHGPDWLLRRKDHAMFVAETNFVFRAGERIPAKFLLQHYGERPLAGAWLDWRLTVDGVRICGGETDIGSQEVGPTRQVAQADIVVPDLPRASRARLDVGISDREERIANEWDFWLFPKDTPSRAAVLANAVAKGVVIAAAGSPEATAAVAAGGKVVSLANQTGPANVFLGWWRMGAQVGMCVARHPALKHIPHEDVLTPLLFGIVKEGLPLPVEGVTQDDLVVAGEGRDACYAYLAQRRHANGAREMLVAGLDLTTDSVVGAAVLQGIVEFLSE